MNIGKLAPAVGFAASIALASGCAQDFIKAEPSKEADAFAATSDPRLQPFLSALFQDGEWGSVLNFDQLGLAAMEVGRNDLAAKAFDASILRIESIYANDSNAQKAKSVYSAEKVKDFKGEPYERSMVYYYRGLLYAHEGDYQNAKASFLAADRHVALSLNEKYDSDFGAMKYLAGWSSYCAGDKTAGSDLVKEARNIDKTLGSGWPAAPGRHIVLIDKGAGPVKVGAGKHKELLQFQPAPPIDDSDARIRLASGTASTPFLLGDVTYQAMNRGGRPVDAILAGKAQFKEGMATARDVSLATGIAMTEIGIANNDMGMANAGLAGSILSMAFAISEAASNPAADTRAWSSLPAQFVLYSSSTPADGKVQLVRGSAEPSALPLQSANGACSLAWGRTVSGLAPQHGGMARLSQDRARETGREERNKAFRAMLSNDFAPILASN